MFETLNGDHAGQVLPDEKTDLSINNKHWKRRERGGYGKRDNRGWMSLGQRARV